ncbi:twin transmembrane helix small protein [soil metagenome]
MRIIILLGFVVIIGSLISAGVFMVRNSKTGKDGKAGSRNMVWALTVRIGVSVALFLCLMLAYRLGWIHPTGLPIGR